MLNEEQIMDLIDWVTESTMEYVLELERLKKEGRLRGWGGPRALCNMRIFAGIAAVDALYWALETPFPDMKTSHMLMRAWGDSTKRKVKV